MAWIESHQGLLTHRKTARLARRLDVPKVTVIGHLHAFWWWAIDNTPDGDLTALEAADVADGACWEGEPEAFMQAMAYAGFIDVDADGTRIHEWLAYTGRLLEQRKLKSARLVRNRQLYADMDLVHEVRQRDGDQCRYCGRVVDWADRKSAKGGTYDHLDPDGPNTPDNVVVACKGCNSAKGRRTPDQAGMRLIQVENLPSIHQKSTSIGRLNSTVPNRTGPNSTGQNRTVPVPVPVPETRDERATAVAAPMPPAELQGFDLILQRAPGYVPSAEFYEKVLERYRDVDLSEEALKLAGWLNDPRQRAKRRTANTATVLSWLKRAATDKPQEYRNGHSNDYRNGTRAVDTVDALAKYDG